MPMKPERVGPLWTEGRPIGRARGPGPRIVAGFVMGGGVAAIAFRLAGEIG